MHESAIEKTINNTQGWPFDIVAVPQNTISKILHASTSVASTPVNIKIRVRNKKEKTNENRVITVPKLSTYGPKKVRLISSDQTIISFDLFMESENVKKVPKKSHLKFLKLFRASGCFNNPKDDDIYPYVPSTSNEIYRARSTSNVEDLKDDKKSQEQSTLKKNFPVIAATSTLKTPTFFGKCKPGGCLDPPFGEDKYIYEPKHQKLTSYENNCKIQEIINEKNIEDDFDTTSQRTPSKPLVKEIHSQSLITYPPVLAVSEKHVQENRPNKKSKPKTACDNKIQISQNELSDIYFMPTRKQKSYINEKLNTEFLSSLSCDNNVKNIETFSLTNQQEQEQESLEFLPIPTGETLNKTLETKISYLKTKSSELSNINFLKDVSNANIAELSDTNILESKEKVSLSEAGAIHLSSTDDIVQIKKKSNSPKSVILKGTENLVSDKMNTLLETDLEKSTTTTSPLSYKDKILTEDLQILTKENQVSGDEVMIKKTETNLEPTLKAPNNLMDNFSPEDHKQLRLNSILEHQALRSNFMNERKMEFRSRVASTESTSSDTALNESLLNSANLIPGISKEMMKEHQDFEEIIRHKDPISVFYSQTSVKEQIQNNEPIDWKTSQNIESTTNIYKEKNNTTDLLETEALIEIENINDHQKSLKSSEDLTTIDEPNLMLLNNHDFKVDSNVSNKKPTLSYIFQTSSKLQTQETKVIAENHDYNEDKLTINQNLSFLPDSITSLNLPPPLVLQKEISSSLLQVGVLKKDADTRYATNSILELPSSLNVSDTAAAPLNYLEVNSMNDGQYSNSQMFDTSQSLVEVNTHISHDIISTNDIFPKKQVDKQSSLGEESLDTGAQIQLMKIQEGSILLDNEKSIQNSHKSADFSVVSIDAKPEDQSRISNNYPDYVNPLKISNSKEYSISLKEHLLSDYKNELAKVDSIRLEEKLLHYKSSSIEINFGFHAFLNDRNKTILNTFDISENLKIEKPDKLTIIKSMIRTDDNEIRLPVNSDMDLSLQIRKCIHQGSTTKTNHEDDKKVLTDVANEESINKTILLQKTLDSVYENLVPIENIIKNLKQEADFLTQQQCLFRELLNTLKTKTLTVTNTGKKCNCNKL